MIVIAFIIVIMIAFVMAFVIVIMIVFVMAFVIVITNCDSIRVHDHDGVCDRDHDYCDRDDVYITALVTEPIFFLQNKRNEVLVTLR